MSTEAISLGFIDQAGDRRLARNKSYDVIPANGDKMVDLAYPKDSEYRTLDVDVYRLYINELPEWFGNEYEGLLRISVNTRNPKQRDDKKEEDIAQAISFEVSADESAPGFLSKGVFRQVLFRDYVNLRFDLYEIDKDLRETYGQVKDIFGSIPELKSLDVTSGIPYLSLATSLVDGLITTFGKNDNDKVWEEVPTLEVDPILGGAFLRSGIYVLFQNRNDKDKEMVFEDLKFKNERLTHTDPEFDLSNYLVFGTRLRPFSPPK